MILAKVNNIKLSLKKGDCLFQNDIRKGIFIPSSCNKSGLCKECIIRIESGHEHLNQLTLEEKHLKYPYRLACKTVIISEKGTIIFSTLKNRSIEIEDNGIDPDIDFVRNFSLISEDKFKLKSKIVVNKNQKSKNQSGIAVDIGTTTVVLWLVELKTGRILKKYSFENPQRFAGSNVMSRIQFDSDKNNKGELQKILVGKINEALKKMNVSNIELVKIYVGGNSAMRDIFFGINVYSIGQSPYISLTELELQNKLRKSTSIISNPKSLNINACSEATIYSPPLIGNLIGSDITAGLIASDFFRNDKNLVFIDIGTNTEIIVKAKGKYYSASSPSGPAFEGSGINCGMPAMKGSITDIKISDRETSYSVLGNIKPIGVCGSGLISLLSGLRNENLINEFGRFSDDSLEGNKFYIDEINNIYITENDINQLIQAKSSNQSALKILLEKSGLDANEIDEFYIAGGFGKHISLEHSINIGLLPQIEITKFKKLGNAAIEGLSMTLINETIIDYMEQQIKKIKVISLEKEETFFNHFTDSCRIAPYI